MILLQEQAYTKFEKSGATKSAFYMHYYKLLNCTRKTESTQQNVDDFKQGL